MYVMAEENIQNIAFKSFEIKDEFIPHGNSTMIESSLGLSTIDIVLAIKNWVDSK